MNSSDSTSMKSETAVRDDTQAKSRATSPERTRELSSSTLYSESNVLEKKQEAAQSPSESSWAAISQIVVTFFLCFNTWGLINTFGTYQTYYSSTGILHRVNSQISWIGSLQAFLILATLIITGPLFDRGYARQLVYVGIVFDVLGMMMTSIATEYWQLMLCQGLCMGLGYGCLFIVAVGQIALTFKRKRWLALGIGQSGGSIGAIIYTEIFRQLQPRIGAGWATRTIAFIMLATLSAAAILLRVHKLPKPRAMFDASAFRNKPFLAFAVASFTGFLGLYIPFFYIQEYALSHGLAQNKNIALAALAILNTGSVFGRILPGFAADRFGLLNVYLICALGAGTIGFVWIGCASAAGIIVFAILYGFFSGCSAALQPAVLASLSPKPELVGTWVGMGSLFSAAGLLLGNPLGGLLFDHLGWLSIQLWCGLLVMACAAATAATRVLRAGTDLNTKI